MESQQEKLVPEAQKIYESLPLALCALRPGTPEPAALSEGLCRFFGVGREELGRMIAEEPDSLAHPDDRGRLRQFRRYVLEHPREKSRLSLRLRGADGGYVQTLCSVCPERPDGGELLLLQISDAVDRGGQPVRPEEPASGREAVTNEVMKNIMLNTRKPVFWKDLHRHYLGANPAFLDCLGFEREEQLLGKTDEELGWLLDCPRHRADEGRLMAENVPVSAYDAKCFVSGAEHEIILSKSPLYVDGKLAGLFGTFEDITRAVRDRERLEAAEKDAEKARSLMSENERLSRILENVPAGLAACILEDGKIRSVTVNRNLSSALGIADGTHLLAGQEEIFGYVDPDDRARCRKAFRRFLETGEDAEGECRLLKAGSGESFWTHIRCRMAKRPDGATVAYLAYSSIEAIKNTELALRASRHMYESAVRAARLTLFEYDIRAHRIRFSDDEITAEDRARFGFPAVLGNVPESLSAFIDERDMPKVREMFRSAEAGRSDSCEVWYRSGAGQEPRCERMICTVELDASGRPARAFCIGQNITAERRLEERYESEMEFLRLNSDQSLIAKRHNNLTRNTVVENAPISPRAHKLPEGLSYDETVGELYGLVTDAGERARLLKLYSRENLIERFWRGETRTDAEYRRGSEDGLPLWFRVSVNTHLTPSTGDIESFSYTYDVTEKCVRGQILSKLTELGYDELGLISAKNGACRIFLFSEQDGRIVTRETGGDYDEGLQRHLLGAIVPEERPRTAAAMQLETILRNLEQSPVYRVSSSIGPEGRRTRQKQFQFSWLDGSREIVFFCMCDVTEQYETERRQIAELSAAKLEADRANQAKSSFLSGMSHDLRTPLNGVVGFTEIALREKDPEKVRGYLEKIRLSGSLLLALVNDTLELSRIESGKLTLEPEAIDSREIDETVLTSVLPMAEQRGVRLIADTASFPRGRLLADRLKTQKIVLNLLSNAVKYTPAGGTVRYSVERLDPSVNGCTRRIRVEDNGIGMSAEFQKRLFEPFAQENRPEAASVVGTGLGLTIVKRVVDLMQGSIAVESAMNRGTAFTVELPLPELEDAPEPQPESGEAACTLRGRRVLLCEDNRLNREIAELLLREKQVAVDSAPDGKAGLERFAASEEGTYDAILMDLRMPVMDGCTAAASIRALERRDAGTIPILAVTADAFEEDIRLAMKAGMNGYLTKPIEPERLIAVLRKAIEDAEQRAGT